MAAATAAEAAGISFPDVSSPLVSVVIPVHNHLDVTLRCLRALMANSGGTPYEVIVADDASTDSTNAVLGKIDGLKLVTLQRNLGFQRAITAGIEVARGKYALMLNNDTEVREGWLEPLVETAERDATVGAVVSKLVFPDGLLQEAGCVVWNDGSAWNVGYGCHADDPTYNYVREVDYGSAAALLVRRDAFIEAGGFDSRFEPAYYEDTDLCFKLQERGYSVMYQPRSTVMHIGGYSHDVAADPAKFTRVSLLYNRRIFAGKWASRLDRHWPPNTAGGYRGGRIERRPHVLLGCETVPASDIESSGLRLSGMAQVLQQIGCRVTLLATNGLRPEPYTTRLQQLGIEVLYSPWGIDYLAENRPGLYDLVILEGTEVAEGLLDRVRSAFPAARVLYDAGYFRHRRDPGSDDNNDTRRRELRMARSADLVAVDSEDEAQAARAAAPDSEVVVLPHLYRMPPVCPPYDERRAGLLFAGDLQNPANADAVGWFVQEVLPLIRKRIDAKLTVLGPDPTQATKALAPEAVVVTGQVGGVREYFDRAAVFVAPLRHGAGMHGKVGHAMSLGVPVVTTTVGAEGMGIEDGIHAYVRDDAAGFADAVAVLATDRSVWEQMSRSAFHLVGENFSQEAMRGRLRALLQSVGTFDLSG